MILLGLVLIVLGAAVAVVAYIASAGQSQTVDLDAWGWTRAFTAVELLIVGAVALLLIWLGWAAISAALRRRTRVRREERERERYAELERTHMEYKAEQERRFEEARLRDEDFTRREEELRSRGAALDTREIELKRHEADWRQRPSRADVVTGRAEGSVAAGTAEWSDDSSTRPLDTAHGDRRDAADERARDERMADRPDTDEVRHADEQASDSERPREARRTDPA